jgi:hypothetical protein
VHSSVTRHRFQVQLQDILAVVVGYGMAALLFRAFWPANPPAAVLGIPAVVLYLWLGLAMSGPILIVRRGQTRQHPTEVERAQTAQNANTWAELGWSLIGLYWIVLGVVVIPFRLHEFRAGDMALFGLVPLVVGLGFRMFGPRPAATRPWARRWTHRAAVVLLLTWPAAWVSLIVLGEALW